MPSTGLFGDGLFGADYYSAQIVWETRSPGADTWSPQLPSADVWSPQAPSADTWTKE